MKGRVTIDVDIDPSQITQLQRTGFLVHKRGSKFSLEVGGNLIAHDKVIVKFEEVHHECAESASKPGGSEERER